jgi:hypothetical protein
MTTAREMIEQARSGTITGPPFMIMPIRSNKFDYSFLRVILGFL